MIKRYKKFIVVALVLGLMVGLMTGCGSKKSAKPASSKHNAEAKEQQQTAIPVRVTKAQVKEIAQYIKVTGEAKPVKSAKITPELQEKVDQVVVEVGDKVERGAKLVQLNQEDARARLEEARAALESSKAGLNDLLAGTREEEIDQLKAELEKAKANYKQSKRNYKRYQNLFEKEVISQQELEAKETGYIIAKNSYQSAQERLKMAQEGPTKEQIAMKRAQVKQAKASFNTARLNFTKTKITAPINGLVAEVNIEEGEMASPQKPVVSIVNLHSVEIKTYVSEQYINKLEVGQQVAVDFNALNRDLKGKIKTISPMLNSTQKKFPVEITIDNSSKLIKSGMYATVKLKTDVSSENIVVPKESVINDQQKSYVYVIKNNKAIKKEVTTGLATKDEVVILSGVKAGAQVVTRGAEQVTDGYQVRIVGGGE